MEFNANITNALLQAFDRSIDQSGLVNQIRLHEILFKKLFILFCLVEIRNKTKTSFLICYQDNIKIKIVKVIDLIKIGF